MVALVLRKIRNKF